MERNIIFASLIKFSVYSIYFNFISIASISLRIAWCMLQFGEEIENPPYPDMRYDTEY